VLIDTETIQQVLGGNLKQIRNKTSIARMIMFVGFGRICPEIDGTQGT
jgi:hypothetical protein